MDIDLDQRRVADAAKSVDLAGLDPEAYLLKRLYAGELFGDGAHLEDYWITLRVLGRHKSLRLQCMTSLSGPANRGAV